MLVWITGGSTGIGRAVALALADEGHTVVISAIDNDRLNLTANQHKNLIPLLCDVTDTAQVATTIQTIERDHGAIDMAILNAGGWNKNNLGQIDFADIQRTYDLNVFGQARALEHLVPLMKARGRGHIVMTASILGYRGGPLTLPYSSSKAAVLSMAQTLRLDLAEYGIKVQVIVPGFVKTPLTDRNVLPMPALITPERAAQHIVRGLKKKQFEIAFPWRLVFWVKLLQHLPYAVYFPLVNAILYIVLKRKQAGKN